MTFVQLGIINNTIYFYRPFSVLSVRIGGCRTNIKTHSQRDLCPFQMDLDLAGPARHCFLPQLHEDNFSVQFQGNSFIMLDLSFELC